MLFRGRRISHRERLLLSEPRGLRRMSEMEERRWRRKAAGAVTCNISCSQGGDVLTTLGDYLEQRALDHLPTKHSQSTPEGREANTWDPSMV